MHALLAALCLSFVAPVMAQNFDREYLDENDSAMFGAKAESAVVSWIAELRKSQRKAGISRAESDLPLHE